jgi:RNA polymerase sigma factor (sigma-70 family)
LFDTFLIWSIALSSIPCWRRMSLSIEKISKILRKKGFYAMPWQRKRISFDDLPELRADNCEYWDRIDNEERERVIEDGMQRLPPRDRLFLKLHFKQGLSLGEVAETMKISVNNAYTIKHRAIERLKSSVASITESNS